MSTANIFEYVMSDEGKTIGAYRVAENVENADAVVLSWNQKCDYKRVFYADHSTASALHMLPSGKMVESVSPYMCPQMYR